MQNKCARCGNYLRVSKEQVGFDEYGRPTYKNFAICDTCQTKVELYSSDKRKQSSLSTASCLLSLFGCTLIIGFILAIIDLSKKDKTEKHTGSIFAVVIFALYLVLVPAIFRNTTSSESQNQTSSETQVENPYYEQGDSFVAGDLRITIDSVDLNYADYDHEREWYDPGEGMKYISVSFTYENIGDSDAYVSIYDYDCYADGTLMEQTYYFGGDFMNANISSGRNVSFETFYIVPENAEEIELEYSELVSFSSEKIIIKLK